MAVFPEIIPQFDGADGAILCDEMLMHEITQRRQQALKELYSRYSRSLRALIGSVVHEESEADDVLQESFLQIWREAHHYSPKAGKPLGYVNLWRGTELKLAEMSELQFGTYVVTHVVNGETHSVTHSPLP